MTGSKERHRARQGCGEQVQREVREVRVTAPSSLQERACHQLVAQCPSDGSGGWKERVRAISNLGPLSRASGEALVRCGGKGVAKCAAERCRAVKLARVGGKPRRTPRAASSVVPLHFVTQPDSGFPDFACPFEKNRIGFCLSFRALSKPKGPKKIKDPKDLQDLDACK